jgi:4-amino-4-deoxy-L-arabinose transferase-like glycosyltransferase
VRPGGAVALAIALRLLLPAAAWLATLDETRFKSGDSDQYLILAGSLARDARYADANGPNLARPPGYPLFLVAGVWLAHPILWALLVQALLGGVMTAAVFEATRLLTREPRAATFAALLAACDPVTLAWSSSVMAEALLAALLAVAALALIRGLQDPGPRRFVLAGLVFAAAALVKAIVSVVVPVVALGLLALPPSTTRRRRAVQAGAFLAAAVLPLSAWTLRNGLVADYWAFSSTADRVLSFAAPASVAAARQGRPFTQVREDWRTRFQKPGFETAERMTALRARGLETILAHPWLYARIHARGMARTLFAPGMLPLLELFDAVPVADGRPLGVIVKDDGAVAALVSVTREPRELTLLLALGAMQALLLGMAVVGLVRTRGGNAGVGGLLALALAAFLVFSGGPWGQSRFRAPMIPGLCILAGAGLARRFP